MIERRLTTSTVIRYLEEAALLPRGSREPLDVEDRSSMHLGFAVARAGSSGGPRGWFVKQGLGRDGAQAIAREQNALRHLQNVGGAGLAPEVLHADADDSVLVSELLSRNGGLHAERGGPEHFSAAVGAALGESLGRLHSLPPPSRKGGGPAPVPFALVSHRPRPESLAHVSPADLELIKLIQGSTTMCARLDGLRAEWRREAFIHGDVRWENCLVADAARRGPPEIRLVDWERAGAGDPALDLGAAFAEYLRSWVGSMQLPRAASPGEGARSASRPLEAMADELNAIWSAYADVRGLDGARRHELLQRAVTFAGVRMIGAAYEQTQDAERPAAGAVIAIQVAENLLTSPWQVGARAIGLEP